MARSLDSILSDQPTIHDLPESDESAQASPQTETGSENAEQSESEEKPESKESVKAKQSQGNDHDDEAEEHVPEDLTGLKKALQAARGDKRKARKQWQETERKLAELQGRLSAMDQMRAQPAAKKPEEFDLNDETLFSKGSEAVKEYVARQVAAVRDEQRNQRLNHSESAARERHEDFQESMNSFFEMAKADPSLWQKMEASHDPGEFVYKTGKIHDELRGVNSIEDLKAKIRKEIEAEMHGNGEPASQGQERKQIKAPPRSIAGMRGTSVNTQTWSGPRPLEDIFR